MTSRRIASALSVAAFCLFAASAPLHADELQNIQSLAKQGNLNQALDRVNAYLNSRPKDAQARFLKGVILSEQNKTAEAVKVFTALTEDYPELPEPYNNLAVLYASQQQYDKARQALEMAIQTHPSYATAHENLGDIYAKMASQAYDRALQLDKSNAAAQTKLALIKDIFPINTRTQRPTVAAGKPAPTAVATAPVAAPAVQKPVTPPPVAAPSTAPTPIKAAEKPVEKVTEKPAEKADKAKQDPTPSILAAVNNWAKAWSDQDVRAYLGHYAPDFKTPKGESRSAWEQQRKERVSAPKRIEVTINNPKVNIIDEQHASVTFRQHYDADTLNSSTTKTLVLVKSGDKWLIQQERIGN